MASSAKVDRAVRQRGRPRSASTDDRIVAAARHLLIRDGFEALSFEGIAREAGVTRPTIYRRWPTKAHLVHHIANKDGEGIADIIAEQGLEAQIIDFVERLVSSYARSEMKLATAGLYATYRDSPELRDELQKPVESEARARLRGILEQGKQLGLVDPAIDPDAVFDLSVGAAIFRMVLSSAPRSTTLARDFARVILRGVAPSPN